MASGRFLEAQSNLLPPADSPACRSNRRKADVVVTATGLRMAERGDAGKWLCSGIKLSEARSES